MRLLVLENFAEINISQDNQDQDEKKIDEWKVVGISSSFCNQVVHDTHHSKLEYRKLQALLQDGQELAVLNLQTMEISKLELASSIIESCKTYSISPDGQTFFGIQSTGEFVAVCNNYQRVKQIRTGYGMTLLKRPSLLDRVVSNFKAIFGYGSQSQDENLRKLQEQYESLFPIIQPTTDGLAMLCFLTPSEGFLFTCNYSSALKHKHVSNITGVKVPGRWWRVFLDAEIILNWLQGKGKPCLEAQIDYAKGPNRDLVGVVVYSAFAERSLEILYGLIGKLETKYELKWGLIVYEFDWIILEDVNDIAVGEINFITKVSKKADKIAIAVNTYLGVYVYVQYLPGEDSKVKLERMTIPLCPHCDYGNAIYYDKECWISSIEWLSDDCYFACTTRCGALSIFYKTGEAMVMKMKRHEDPSNDLPCNYYYEVFNIRREVEKARTAAARNVTSYKEKNNTEQLEIPRKVLMTWSGADENVLSVFSGSKLSFIRILRVSNYIEASDLKIPVPGMKDSTNKLNIGDNDHRLKWDKCDERNKVEHFMEEYNGNSGERIACSINDFVNSIQHAEIILRPVFVNINDQGSRKPPVQFRFHSNESNNQNENITTVAASLQGQGINSDDLGNMPQEKNDEQRDKENIPLTFPEMETDFSLLPKAPSYTADDESTRTESAATNQESSSCSGPWNRECTTPEPVLRPEYPVEYAKVNEFDSGLGMNSDIDTLSDSNESYSPPFSDDEAEENILHSCLQQTDPLKLLLSMPSVPQIDFVIPFVPRTPFDELYEIGVRPPTARSYEFNKSTSTQTDPNIYTDEYINTGVYNQRCRPICMITQPPPPTKATSQQYFIISDRKRIDATLSTTKEEDLSIFINKLDDDQLGPCPTLESSQSERTSILNNHIILEGKLCKNVKEQMTDSQPDKTTAIFVEETVPDIKIDDEENEKISREKWEKLSGMFDTKIARRKNSGVKFTKKKKIPTALCDNAPNKSYQTVPDIKIDEGNEKQNVPVNNEVDDKVSTEDTEKSNAGSQFKKSILKTSKTIPESSTHVSTEKVVNEKTNDGVAEHMVPSSYFKAYYGENSYLPVNSSSDDGILNILKRKLSSLTTRQGIYSNTVEENDLKKVLHWMNSDTTLLALSPSEQIAISKVLKQTKLKATSQPDFQKKLSNPMLKKAIFSEPQLSRKAQAYPAIKQHPLNGTATAINPKQPASSQRPATPQRPSSHEFTIGPPTTIAISTTVRPKTAKVVKKSTSEQVKEIHSKAKPKTSTSGTGKKITPKEKEPFGGDKTHSTQTMLSKNYYSNSGVTSKKIPIAKTSSQISIPRTLSRLHSSSQINIPRELSRSPSQTSIPIFKEKKPKVNPKKSTSGSGKKITPKVNAVFGVHKTHSTQKLSSKTKNRYSRVTFKNFPITKTVSQISIPSTSSQVSIPRSPSRSQTSFQIYLTRTRSRSQISPHIYLSRTRSRSPISSQSHINIPRTRSRSQISSPIHKPRTQSNGSMSRTASQIFIPRPRSRSRTPSQTSIPRFAEIKSKPTAKKSTSGPGKKIMSKVKESVGGDKKQNTRKVSYKNHYSNLGVTLKKIPISKTLSQTSIPRTPPRSQGVSQISIPRTPPRLQPSPKTSIQRIPLRSKTASQVSAANNELEARQQQKFEDYFLSFFQNAPVDPIPPVPHSAPQPTTDEKHYLKTVGKGLTIHNEVMEDVPLRSARSLQNRKRTSESDNDSDYYDDNENTSRSSSRRRMQRRVSFSNPIAVFKTMSPDSPLKPEEETEEVHP